jgi:hypothetical protein
MQPPERVRAAPPNPTAPPPPPATRNAKENARHQLQASVKHAQELTKSRQRNSATASFADETAELDSGRPDLSKAHSSQLR